MEAWKLVKKKKKKSLLEFKLLKTGVVWYKAECTEFLKETKQSEECHLYLCWVNFSCW